MKQIENNLYHLPVPLPNSPLKEINCYLIRGERRNLLIDTGFNHPICEEALLAQFGEIGIALEDTDVFVTHLHVDHCGLIGRLNCGSNAIYASIADKVWIDGMQTPALSKRLEDESITMCIPDAYKMDSKSHVVNRRKSGEHVDITALREGDGFKLGGFDLRVIELPGHTPGLIGLWEPKRRYLFCGDHILDDISPNISAWDLTSDYLAIYIASLEKVRAMPVARLFPAHRRAPDDINARIDTLIEHHRERTAAIMEILTNSQISMSAFDMVARLEWRIKGPILQAPLQQVWFACSETLSHLQSLRFEGRVKCEERQGGLYYSV